MSSILHYIEEVVVEWEAFGMALSMPYSVVCEINLDKLSIESKRTELIRRWMNTPKKSGPACWLLLVKALEEPSVNMNVVATKIRSDKGKIFIYYCDSSGIYSVILCRERHSSSRETS